MATPNQQFCLRWNNHQPNFIAVFSTLLRSESMCDVTLATEGKHILAHKIVLSACSSYFQMLFAINPCKHPIVILKDVQFKDLKTLIDFVYFGEVNVSQEHLPSLLKTAETLQIKGLTEMPDRQVTLNSIPSSASTPQPGSGGGGGGDIKTESPLGSPSGYKRKRMRKSSAESVATTVGGEDQETSTINTRDIQQSGQHMHATMVKPEPHGQPTPQLDDKSPRSVSMSSAETGPISGNKSDLLLPVKTIILTSSQSKSLDSGIGGDSSAVSSAATSMESSSVSTLSTCLGSKTKRFLMRQHRVKKEYDEDKGEGMGGEEGEGGGGSGKVIARQCSEPAPQTEHLLSVPQTSYLTKQHSHPLIISTSSSSTPISPSFHVTSPTESSASRPLKMEEFRRASSTPQYSLSLPSTCLSSLRDSPSSECRSSHCPELRQGPALGCNFCWNTIDGHGRILRRKTKYHCPECQTNLCIVPCFQQYHERQESEPSGGGMGSTGSRKASTHLQPTFVKTSSL